MGLSRITKHVMYGSMLVQHVSKDLSDLSTSSSSYTNWGSNIEITPLYEDSHLEVTFTGSLEIPDLITDAVNHVYARILINGQSEYEVTGVNGAVNTGGGAGGHRHINNTRFNQHHAQDFNAYQMRTGIGMFHIHIPTIRNNQTVQIQIRHTNSRTVNCYGGFLSVAELSGPGYNLT
jgi:hypothetical protein